MLPANIFLTALAVQFFYILVNWYFFRRKEYILYSTYILIVGAYFLNKYLTDDHGMVQLGGFKYYVNIPDKILAILSYVFYFKFGRNFVNAETRYPSMNTLMKYAELFLLFYVFFDILLLSIPEFSGFENAIFLPVNIAIFIVLIFVFRAMLKKNEVLDKFILTGSMFYAVSALLTLWIGQNKPLLATDHILILQVGALMEMISLNAGLVYKSKMLQNQTVTDQKNLIKRYKENQELLLQIGNIRERISRDLHDDVGATLSSIKAYSEILKENPDNPVIAELIKDNSNEMLERLDLIAWSTNPQNDNLKSLKSKMQKFAAPLCHSKNIQYDMTSNGVSDELMMLGEIRQNLFLVFKEAVNNTVKYADATNCNIKIFIQNDNFILEVADNGKGFQGITTGSGFGLKNMKKRAEEIKGKLDIVSSPHTGTCITMSIPLSY